MHTVVDSAVLNSYKLLNQFRSMGLERHNLIRIVSGDGGPAPAFTCPRGDSSRRQPYPGTVEGGSPTRGGEKRSFTA